MPDARNKAIYLKAHLDNMTDTFEKILRLFGEDPRDEQARTTFFVKIVNFLKEYQVCCTSSLGCSDANFYIASEGEQP